MAENYCYTRPNMIVRRLVEAGHLRPARLRRGRLHPRLPHLMFDEAGGLTWRGEGRRRGTATPTRPTRSGRSPSGWASTGRSAGRDATWTTRRSPASLRRAALRPRPPGGASRTGSSRPTCATTLIRAESGALIVLRRDAGSPRPHNMIHYALQGARGAYHLGAPRRRRPADLDRRSQPRPEPARRRLGVALALRRRVRAPALARARRGGGRRGHGGGDFFVIEDFIDAIGPAPPPPIDVYDAVTWSAIAPLSVESVRPAARPVAVPDFHRGRHSRP